MTSEPLQQPEDRATEQERENIMSNIPIDTERATSQPVSSGNTERTKQTAEDQASELKGTATDAGQQVVATTKDQAQNVASEAVTQGKQLVGQASEQLTGQASKAQQTLADTVRSYAEELTSMSRSDESSGTVSGLARQAADRGHGIADFLENREPRDVLAEVQRFARQRPVAFLGIAAATGFLVGRLTRNLAAEHKEEQAVSTSPNPALRPASSTSAGSSTSTVSPPYDTSALASATTDPAAGSSSPYESGPGIGGGFGRGSGGIEGGSR